MHIGGWGPIEKLAEGVGKVLSRIKEQGVPVPSAELDPASTQLDTEKIPAAVGHRGDLSAGVYRVTIGRTTRMHGHDVGSTMGVNTWAAFSGSNERAVVDGDFAMLESELQPVIRALRSMFVGIRTVALRPQLADLGAVCATVQLVGNQSLAFPACRAASAQYLAEETVTPEVRVSPRLLMRSDIRVDHLNRDAGRS